VYQKCTDKGPCLQFCPTKWADVTAELESAYVKYVSFVTVVVVTFVVVLPGFYLVSFLVFACSFV